MDKQLSKFVCDRVVATSLLLLFGRTNYLLDFLSFAVKIALGPLVGGEGAVVMPFPAFLFPGKYQLRGRLS